MAKNNSESITSFGIQGPFGRYVDFNNKEQQVEYYVRDMFRRMLRAFKLYNLPDTIPERDIKLQLLVNGNIVIADVPDKGIYSFIGMWGGEPSPYYIPTKYTVANPYLNFNKTFTIGDDCVMVKNDSMYQGMLPMFNRYATLLCENDITIKIADINSRLTSLITADNDKSYNSAVEFLKKIYNGEIGIVGTNAFLEGIKTQPVTTAGYSNFISQLIELEQYLKASWYNDIGINANYNMKREAITSNEAQMNSDALLPLIDDMYKCWTEGFNEVNEHFGLNIEVDFDSSWGKRQELYELEIESVEAEVEEKENEDVEDKKDEEIDDEKEGADENERKETD